MTECPTCRLAIESHSTAELAECCMEQADGYPPGGAAVCPNCRHGIGAHTDEGLAECAIAFLGPGAARVP